MRDQPPVAYFVPTEVRPLAAAEWSVVERLLEGVPGNHCFQLTELRVVGRCGCGKCPTIFFERHKDGDREADLASYSGRDASGGLVAAVLLEKDGRLSQLEFYSIDGHDPWGIPDAQTLEPY